MKHHHHLSNREEAWTSIEELLLERVSWNALRLAYYLWKQKEQPTEKEACASWGWRPITFYLLLKELENVGFLRRVRFQVGQARGVTYELYADPADNPAYLDGLKMKRDQSASLVDTQ